VKNSTDRKKLSYKERRELERLPARIESLEAEQRALNERIAGPEFYRDGADAIRVALARVEELQGEIAAVYARWHELEERAG
jgi:ATP-binding cassette subfamily F protein uup